MTSQSDTVKISICIPAYKKAERLTLLLESLLKQDFTSFEVIVSDDSPDKAVQHVCSRYKDVLSLRYFHNTPSLGSPENWNNAIRKASGEWIKIMHDDDMFAGPDSLRKLYELCSAEVYFVFAGYNIIENDQLIGSYSISEAGLKRIRRNPELLIVKNLIGHPSVVMHKNMPGLEYDKRMKWMVDIDFYIQCLNAGAFNFTREKLINIGHHEHQVTRSVFADRNVVLPENLLLLEKSGTELLNHPLVYDYFWRLMRNYEVKNKEDLQQLSSREIPVNLNRLLKFQQIFPQRVLTIGAVSKILMFLSWLINRQK